MGEEEITLLFTGGMDTTLTASLLAKRYKRVHLLTYDAGGVLFLNNSKFHFHELQEIFGKEKFTHEIIDIRDVITFFTKGIWRDIIRYRSPFVCDYCCVLAYHARTIIYNLKNNITYACDGSSYEQSIWTEQRESFISEIKKLYDEFNLKFSTPVYYYGSRKKRRAKLVEMGFSVGPECLANVAFLGSCKEPFGLADLYASPLGRSGLLMINEKKSIEYINKKKELVKEYIDNFLHSSSHETHKKN